MKSNVILISFSIFFTLSAFYIVLYSYPHIIMAEVKPPQLTPSPVYATLPKGSVLYNECNGKAIDLITSGSKVEIIKDRSRQWYYIRFNNKLGWVKREALKIPPDKSTDKSAISEDVFINYANQKLESDTDHFVWVDIARQKVYILKGKKGDWALEKTIICSTGKNTSPSLRGRFKIQDRGSWFYSKRLGSGAKYWVRYSGSYLFHSVAMDIEQNVIDPTLGKKSSNGCIRMSVEDAKWFYENIKTNTSVEIN